MGNQAINKCRAVPALVAILFLAIAIGCDECKDSADCKSGESCIKGSCKKGAAWNPGGDADSDADTDADADGDGDTGGSGDADASVAPGTDAGTDNPLLGRWTEGGGDCSYTYVFDAQGHFTLTCTTGERLRAQYALKPPSAASERFLFEFTVISDNNVVDCEGDVIDETGDYHEAYVQFEGNVAEIYPNETGGSTTHLLERL